MNQGFRGLHPATGFFYYISVTFVIMLYQHPFFLFFSFATSVLLNYLLDGGKTLKGWGRSLTGLALLFLIITPLFNHRGNVILFYAFQNPITLEAVIQGGIHALTLLSIVTLFFTFHLVIDGEKFLFLFSKYFPQWTLLTLLSMRFVPLFKRRLEEIRTVQKIRLPSVQGGPVKQRMKHGLLLLQLLLTWSLEDGIQTADSMAARGYGLRKRSRYIPYRMDTSDILSIVWMTYLVGISIFGWVLGYGVLTLLPYIEPLILSGKEWAYFAAFMFLVGFPLFIEGKEALRWHYWKRNN